MSALSISQTATAVGANVPASFLATGGTEPYTYSVRANGAGGTIDSATGVYTAPAVASSDSKYFYDTIQAVDSATPALIGTAKILVGTPLLLFCDIIQHETGLANGRVYLWDQKIFQPSDDDLYIAVSQVLCKPFGSSNYSDGSGSGMDSIQSVNMLALLDIDIISRGPAARDRKEEVILALCSVYAEQQQDLNSFSIGRLPAANRFINLSNVDGAAIPYRYKISVNMQYFVKKTQAVPYFDTFQTVAVTTDP